MTDCILFYLNGIRQEVRGSDAGQTLSNYLRQSQHQCGTKIACSEGDCGACTILAGRLSQDGSRFEYEPIDSCIAFIYQMHLSHVVTVEGLADSEKLTSVQQCMVDCHGSQCGFCTPGFVMALHGLTETADAPLTEDELRLGLSGNLCRCTGYSQILDAGLSLKPDQITSVSDRFNTAQMLQDFAEFQNQPVHVNAQPNIESNGQSHELVEVMIPKTLSQVLEYRTSHPNAKLVSGATDVGVQYNHGRLKPEGVIYLGQVEEFNQFAIEDNTLTVGAAVRWSELETQTSKRLPEFHKVIERFGSPQVRRAGTLIGNLANASPIADSIPWLYVTEATLQLASQRGTRTVPILDFYQGYKQLDLADDEIIASAQIPLPTDSTRLKLYKIAKRRDMDISILTAAFWIGLDGNQITDARIAFGGVGPTVLRVPRSEELLVGKQFTLEVMTEAAAIARNEVTPISDVRGDAGYRYQLVENLFAKCFHDINPQPTAV